MIVFNDFNKGRLGNQMFSVAATIGIALKNNTTYGFTSNMGHSGMDYQSIFKEELPIAPYLPEAKYFQEQFSYYDVTIEKDVEIIGYFQSEKFFKHCENLIKEQYAFKESVVNEIIEKYPMVVNGCGIHIRRGDYLSQPNHHPVLPMEYYVTFLKNYSDNYNNIFIFSDDEVWAKETFVGDKFIFPTFVEKNDLYCFVLLTLCKDIVICNSTYSWWAGWLNKNQDKKIFAPDHKNWFGPMYDNYNTKDIIPESWETIKF